jgi:hypothetical protein
LTALSALSRRFSIAQTDSISLSDGAFHDLGSSHVLLRSPHASPYAASAPSVSSTARASVARVVPCATDVSPAVSGILCAATSISSAATHVPAANLLGAAPGSPLAQKSGAVNRDMLAGDMHDELGSVSDISDEAGGDSIEDCCQQHDPKILIKSPRIMETAMAVARSSMLPSVPEIPGILDWSSTSLPHLSAAVIPLPRYNCLHGFPSAYGHVHTAAIKR